MLESKCSVPMILNPDDINSYNHQDHVPFNPNDNIHNIDRQRGHLDVDLQHGHSDVDLPRAIPIGPSHDSEKMGFSGILATLFVIAAVVAMGIWVFYAYRNPHTTSGQMLIRYRPSQWRWRRGEARYTAATIHM